MTSKLQELQAVATFGQIGKVGGTPVSPQTAQGILAYYNKLTPALRKQFMALDVQQMKNIAFGIQGGGFGFKPTPEAQVLIDIAKRAYQGEEILRKKYLSPFVAKKQKEIDEFLKKQRKAEQKNNPLLR